MGGLEGGGWIGLGVLDWNRSGVVDFGIRSGGVDG